MGFGDPLTDRYHGQRGTEKYRNKLGDEAFALNLCNLL